MATKADYTDGEWAVLLQALSDVTAYVVLAEGGLWNSFREARGAAEFLGAQKDSSASALVKELAADMQAGAGKSAISDSADAGAEVAARVEAACDLVTAKDPADVPSFRNLVLGLASATAEGSKGIGPEEAKAIETIKAAFGS